MDVGSHRVFLGKGGTSTPGDMERESHLWALQRRANPLQLVMILPAGARGDSLLVAKLPTRRTTGGYILTLFGPGGQ
jgi:hypothetical protein